MRKGFRHEKANYIERKRERERKERRKGGREGVRKEKGMNKGRRKAIVLLCRLSLQPHAFIFSHS